MAVIYFSKPAERDLKRLPKPAITALQDGLYRLRNNPGKGKALHGPLRGYFSFDFWAAGVSYRCAYEIVKGSVIVLMIDTRDNFYKEFLRRVR